MQKDSVQLNGDYYVVDLKHILKALWHRAWVIIIVALLLAAVAFSYANFFVTPMYSSEIMLYVNNNNVSLGSTSFSISASDISAAQSLVKTYLVILNNRTTLEKVIQKAGCAYTYEELSKMISSQAVDETEVMRVTVTTPDPYEATHIANCIAEVLPVRISEVIKGSSMEVVDSGVANLQKVSPSISKYTAIGFIIGSVIAAFFIALSACLDDTIHSEDYIIETYDYPLLATIPDLIGDKASSYSSGYSSAYGYGNNSKKKGNG